MDSSYKCRDDPNYKEDLGNAMVNFARVVPDGLLVFFPSYIVMRTCLDYWRKPQPGESTWIRIYHIHKFECSQHIIHLNL